MKPNSTAPARPKSLFIRVSDRISANQAAPDDDVLAEVMGGPPQAKAPKTAPGATEAVVAAQWGVISGVLADNALYDAVRQLVDPQDLPDSVARLVFKEIGDLLEGRVEGVSVADAVTVCSRPGMSAFVDVNRLRKAAEQAFADAGYPGFPAIPEGEIKAAREALAGKVLGYARIVRDAISEIQLQSAARKVQAVVDGDHSVEERTREVTRILESAAERQERGAGIVTVGDAAQLAIAELRERAARGDALPGATTGIRDLDTVIGGLQPGQLIIIAARPGVGKTALAMSMALAGAEGAFGQEPKAAVFVSMEMGPKELSHRALARIANIPSTKIRMAALDDGEWEGLLTAAETLKHLPVTFTDKPGLDIQGLRALCRSLHREGRLDALFVDYIQIMRGNPKVNREQQIAEISRGLKLLARELSIPVVALSQLNREVEKRVNKRPLLSDLRESGAVEQDADVIMFIHRDEMANPESVNRGVAEVIVGKQRAGPLADVRVAYSSETTTFYDIGDSLSGGEVAVPVTRRAEPTLPGEAPYELPAGRDPFSAAEAEHRGRGRAGRTDRNAALF
jgi:replicative DNA helicase